MNPDHERAVDRPVRVIVEQGASWTASAPGTGLIARTSSLHELRIRVAGYLLGSIPADRVDPVLVDWVYHQPDGSEVVDHQVVTVDDLRRIAGPVSRLAWDQHRVDDYFRRRRHTAS